MPNYIPNADINRYNKTDLVEMYNQQLLIIEGLDKQLLEYKTSGNTASHSESMLTQIGGDHYLQCSIQPVEYILLNNLEFIPGCIIKYATRYNKEGGGGMDDLRKIIHYTQLLMDLKPPEQDDVNISD